MDGLERETKGISSASLMQKEALRKQIVNGEAVPRSIKLSRLMVKKKRQGRINPAVSHDNSSVISSLT